MIIYVFFVCRCIYVFSLTPISYKTAHTCVSIHNTNAYKILSDSHKYFTFDSDISSLTSMTTYVFLVQQPILIYAHNSRNFTCV